MYKWSKTVDFGLAKSKQESWCLQTDSRQQFFPVTTTFGKSVDLAKIKEKYSFKSEQKAVEAKRRYYEDIGEFVDVTSCQVCGASIDTSAEIMPIWSVTYRLCRTCNHTYADRRPTDKVITRYYEETSDSTKSYYMQVDEIDLRIRELYLPKVDWLIKSYGEAYGRHPKRILDIGAGTGHFLRAAQMRGLEVAGLEIDRSYRQFAQDTFGIHLVKDAHELSGAFELITSFNVIEHVLNFNEFMALHRKMAAQESLIAAETPNFESFTVWLQRIFPHRLRGYFTPYEHVQLFTQASLATAFYLHGFGVSHCWMFGQDTRELAYQITAELGGDASQFIDNFFNKIQSGIDQANFGDLILMAAIPLQNCIKRDNEVYKT